MELFSDAVCQAAKWLKWRWRNCLINRFGTLGRRPLVARKAPKWRFRPRWGLPQEATVAISRNYQTVSVR